MRTLLLFLLGCVAVYVVAMVFAVGYMLWDLRHEWWPYWRQWWRS